MNIYNRYKSDYKANLVLALPLILGQVGQIIVNFVDNLMVGKLGVAELAAVSLANAIFISLLVVGMGISFALPPLVAAENAKNNISKIAMHTKHSLIVNLIFAALGIIFIESIIPLMSLLKQEPEVVKFAIPYLRISAYSLIPFMLFQTFRCYADGRSETLPAMLAMLAANVINVAANYILIYGKYGAPKLGVSGAAWGTFISRVFMLIMLVLILKYWKNLWACIQSMNLRKYENSEFRQILKLGIPTSMQGFFEVSAFGGASILAGMISKEAQAAHQIAISLASISFLICTGLAMAATIRVGNQIGNGNRTKVRSAGFSAIIQVALFMTFTSILYIVSRHVLPTLYVDDQYVIQIAAGLLIMASIFQIPDGIQVTTIGALRGMQDVVMPTIFTFIAYWLMALPFGYFLAFKQNLGVFGIWVGLTLGLTISAILLIFRFNSISKKV